MTDASLSFSPYRHDDDTGLEAYPSSYCSPTNPACAPFPFVETSPGHPNTAAPRADLSASNEAAVMHKPLRCKGTRYAKLTSAQYLALRRHRQCDYKVLYLLSMRAALPNVKSPDKVVQATAFQPYAPPSSLQNLALP